MTKFVSVSRFRAARCFLTSRNLTEQLSQNIIIFNRSTFLRRHISNHTLNVSFLLALFFSFFPRPSHIMFVFSCFLDTFFIQIIVKNFSSIFDITTFSYNILICVNVCSTWRYKRFEEFLLVFRSFESQERKKEKKSFETFVALSRMYSKLYISLHTTSATKSVFSQKMFSSKSYF